MNLSGDRVFEFLDLAHGATVTGKQQIPIWKMSGDVIFKDVGFTYSTRETPILRNCVRTQQGNQKLVQQ